MAVLTGERRGGWVLLTLDRPEKKNALSIELRDAVTAALDEAAADESVVGVAITGRGDIFSAGWDLAEFGAAAQDAELMGRIWRSGDAFHHTLLTFPLPLVAAVNGPALAGAFDLAACCDVRIAATTARFAHPERTWADLVCSPFDALVPGAVARDVLLAGMEIDLKSLAGRQGRWAWTTWTVGFVVAVAATSAFVPDAALTQSVALGLAISSTALGTLLPILKDRGLLPSALGRSVLTHGAVGEIGPVVVMALLLTSHSPLQAGLLMAFFVVVTIAAIVVPTRLLHRAGLYRVGDSDLSPWSLRTLLRGVMLLLTGLMALAAILEFDVVLGAFAAGVALSRIGGRHAHAMMRSLEQVGFGFFIPMFFVASGMAIEIAALAEHPWVFLGLALLIGVARGLPVFLTEQWADTGSGLNTTRERLQLGLYAATGLPIIVAVTEVALSSDLMKPATASLLVGAGALTVLAFPFAAQILDRSTPAPLPR